MIYGEWELRDDVTYYQSQNIIVFPTSNSTDSGKLTIEENMREIVTRITNKNYALRDDYFKLSMDNDVRNVIYVSPGRANIQGYCVITNKTIAVPVPNESNRENQIYTIGMALSYDGSDHVCGDVMNKDADANNSEIYSGAYIKFFKPCEIEQYGDRILILGQVTVKNGQIVVPPGIVKDPFIDHRIDGDEVELNIHGLQLTSYDTRVENITNVEAYETVKNKIEQNTKPPTFTTDMQDYSDYIPDWYASKYGDFMTGALTMRHINSPIKNNKRTDSIFISPRYIGKLDNNTDPRYDETHGGSLISIVPGTYDGDPSISGNTGDLAGIFSAKNADTGLVINNVIDGSHSRLVNMPNLRSLIMDHKHSNGDTTSITMVDGVIEIDSKPSNPSNATKERISNHVGSSSESTKTANLKINQLWNMLEISSNSIDVNQDAGTTQYDIQSFGLNINKSYAIDNNQNVANPWHRLGDLRLSSILSIYKDVSLSDVRHNKIESVDTRSKYVEIKPRIMTEESTSRDRVQVGILDDEITSMESNKVHATPYQTAIIKNSKSTHLTQVENGNVINRIGHINGSVRGIFSQYNIGSSDKIITDIENNATNPFDQNSNYVMLDNTDLYFHTTDTPSEQASNTIHFMVTDNGQQKDDMTISYVYCKDKKDKENTSGSHLQIRGGGLEIEGDINHPDRSPALTVTGDSNFGRVYNAVYNDYAEYYKKASVNENIEAGDIIVLDPKTGNYTKSKEKDSRLVIGVYSDTYGFVVGGDKHKNMMRNLEDHVPVGLCGRVLVKCITQDVKPGDLIVSSDIDGCGMVNNEAAIGTVIGKALGNIDKDGRVLIQIMLS